MIQTRAEFRFDNPVLQPDPFATRQIGERGQPQQQSGRPGIFSTYWQRALGGLVILVNALISSRNTGVTGAIATGVAINHGLDRAPKFVTLAPQDGTPTNYFADNIGPSMTNPDSTFRVNYTGGGTHIFGWSAET